MIDIVAVDKNWGIGKNNDLLIEIPEDKKFFKDTTINNIVFMGKNTLDSLPKGKPLKNRVNIVLTNKELEEENIIVVHSKEEALEAISKYEKEKVFNIGGAKIFKEMLDYAEYSLVTKIYEEFDADVFYPNLDKLENWNIVEQSEIKEWQGIKYKFYIYQNKEFNKVSIDIKNNGNMFYTGNEKQPDSKIVYTLENGIMSINSTVVNPKLRGKGLAGIITKHVLEFARENKLRVKPVCSYTVDYFNKHKEYENIEAYTTEAMLQ